MKDFNLEGINTQDWPLLFASVRGNGFMNEEYINGISKRILSVLKLASWKGI